MSCFGSHHRKPASRQIWLKIPSRLGKFLNGTESGGGCVVLTHKKSESEIYKTDKMFVPHEKKKMKYNFRKSMTHFYFDMKCDVLFLKLISQLQLHRPFIEYNPFNYFSIKQVHMSFYSF